MQKIGKIEAIFEIHEFMSKIMKTYVLFTGCFLLFTAGGYGEETSEAAAEVSAPRNKTAYDYYHDLLSAYQAENWKNLILTAKALHASYEESPFNAEAHYYKGVAYYHLGDYDFANESFSEYLRNETTPKFFEDAIEYKFQIAEKFYEGARRHFLGFQKLPRIIPARDEALEIYEEIITTLPRHDLTARSLYKKGCLLYEFNDYKPSVEAFQVLIRRFPRHYLSPEAFLGIQKVYLKQAQQEFPDPDILELATINLQKFTESFPGESRLEDATKMLTQMEDSFAQELFETGFFYEKTHKLDAAAIYYANLITKYPYSTYAQKAQRHLEKIAKRKEPPRSGKKQKNAAS